MLSQWPPGTVLVLVTGGEEPHAIPVSAAVLGAPSRVLIGLAKGRDSLARLQASSRVALVIMAEADVAITAYGTARVLDDELTGGVRAVAIDVDRVQDHGRPTFVIESGVGWRWSDPQARGRDQEVRAALERLVEG
jgi:flavin reductase (DIM6/NTAB) family NADH-FMN oxidoreductase RutF